MPRAGNGTPTGQAIALGVAGAVALVVVLVVVVIVACFLYVIGAAVFGA